MTTMTSLGGPGVACSIMRVRRLAAGELLGDERLRTEAHLAGCARCQAAEREIAGERVRVERELPFEIFAAGVAERLAAPPRPARRFSPAVGLALAAGLAFAVVVPAVLSVVADRSDVRVKGSAEIALWAGEPGGARLLAPGEPVPARAALRVGLSPGARRFAAVALLDEDGAVVLHAGPASPGVLPGAFEWTGVGEGTLVAVLDDRPVDAAALAARLARGGTAAASPGGSAEVVVRKLRRGPP